MENPLAHFHLIPALLYRVRNNDDMATIRCFLNGVCTSHRMHTASDYYYRFGCFGPACLDDLPHYLNCPIVEDILLSFETADTRPVPLFPSPLHRSLWRWQALLPLTPRHHQDSSLCEILPCLPLPAGP